LVYSPQRRIRRKRKEGKRNVRNVSRKGISKEAHTPLINREPKVR
jgi:hypothetical protein